MYTLAPQRVSLSHPATSIKCCTALLSLARREHGRSCNRYLSISCASHFTTSTRSILHRSSLRGCRSAQLCKASAVDTEFDNPSAAAADAILLAWFAAQNSSVFAAQCLVEVVIECYRRGMLLDELQVAIQLKCMQIGNDGEPVLEPFQQDVLVSWILLVMVTLQHIGLQRDKCPGTPPDVVTRSMAQVVQGMEGYMLSTLSMYDEGYTLERLLGLQNMVGQAQEQQGSFAYLMKQYSRLVLTTLELCRAQGLTTSKPLTNPTAFASPTGYTDAFLGSETEAPCLRSQAVQLLVSFMGGVLGSRHAMAAFVQQALQVYSQGVSAGRLFGLLSSGEFMQSGGLLPVAQQLEVFQEVNKQLFGRWLSIVYIAAAQAGVVYPGEASELGWAWAGSGDSVEAHAISQFVTSAIRSVVAAPQRREQQDLDAADTSEEVYDPLAERIWSHPESAAELERVRMAEQQQLQQQGVFMGQEVPLLVKVQDPELSQTSAAVKVMSQQMQLVRLVVALAEQQRRLDAEGGSQ